MISTASSAILLQKELNILDDTELVDYCNKITNNTEYLSKIIDNVSNILEDTIESSQINIDDIFERNSMLLFGNTLENKIKINLNIENNIVITGNRNKFIEILLAITSNSIELFEDMELDNKSIFVNVKKDRNNCKLYIYDNGNGMPALLINRVFEPYFTTKHKSQGKGLGLYLVKKSIEELFKGSISVSNIEFMNNQKREKGACFEISIPFR